MGTVPLNFPPDAIMEIGNPILTGSKLGNTGPFTTTVFFTSPTTGLYDIAALLHITQTDGAGTLTLTITPPFQSTPTAFVPNVRTGPVTSDMSLAPRLVFMPQGSQVTCSVSGTGLGATTYNVFLPAIRTF